MRALHDACQQLSSRSITVLSVGTPESDWARWDTELAAVVASYGPDFTAALEHVGNIPAATVPGVLADEPLSITAPQLRQHALYAFISNSIDIKDEPGSARRLIAGLQHGGGSIGGVPQAYRALRDRYFTDEVPEDPTALMQKLLAPQWPRKLSRELLQAHLRQQQRLAEELHMSPAGGTPSEVARRKVWWPTIAEPPKGSVFEAAAQRASTRTGGANTTVAHRNAFIDAFLDEVLQQERRLTRTAAAHRQLLLTAADAHGSAAVQSVRAFLAAQQSLQHPEQEAMAVGDAPRPTYKKHPCVRCGSVSHPKGFKCTVPCKCEVCLSDGHVKEYCWVKNGVLLGQERCPAVQQAHSTAGG